jgi:hypothetical protein
MAVRRSRAFGQQVLGTRTIHVVVAGVGHVAPRRNGRKVINLPPHKWLANVTACFGVSFADWF